MRCYFIKNMHTLFMQSQLTRNGKSNCNITSKTLVKESKVQPLLNENTFTPVPNVIELEQCPKLNENK